MLSDPLQDVTVGIVVRIDSEARMRNLTLQAPILRAHGFGRVLVLEWDPRPRCAALCARHGLVHLALRSHRPVNKSRAINLLAERVRTPYFMMLDVDVFPTREQLRGALALLRGGRDLVYPYDGDFWCVDPPAAPAALLREWTGRIVAGERLHGAWIKRLTTGSVGGCFLVRTEAFRRIGRMNERFLGWGPEDQELAHRASVLGLSIGRAAGPLTHYNHPKGEGFYDLDLIRSNLRLFSELQRMDPADLLRAATPTSADAEAAPPGPPGARGRTGCPSAPSASAGASPVPKEIGWSNGGPGEARRSTGDRECRLGCRCAP